MPREISISEITLDEPLQCSVFSSIGDLLVEEGTVFTESRLEVFKANGADKVYLREDRESDDDCRYELRYTKTPVEKIKPKTILGLSVFDERGQLLVQEGAELMKGHRTNLANQGIEFVYIEREEIDRDATTLVIKLRKGLNQIAVEEATTEFGEAFQKEDIESGRVSSEPPPDLTDMEALLEAESQREIKRDDKVRKLVEADRLMDAENPENMEALSETRKELLERLTDIFEDLSSGKFTDGKEIGKFVRAVVDGLVSNRFHRLHIIEPEEDQNYLPSHSLNTCIFSINMAARIGYAMNEILELGYAAVLHDVGMMKVSQEIVNKKEPLTPAEKTEIRNHPGLGVDMLQTVRSLPVTTRIVCYQENERLDGSGYPIGKTASVLLAFTRIVSVAAVFDAMSRERPYREGLGPYDALSELLHEVHSRHLDTNVVRSLLETLSLFPIASGVELSDGRAGYVLDTAGDNYTRPVIAVEYDEAGRPYTREVVIDLQQAEHQGISIARTIPRYTRRVAMPRGFNVNELDRPKS